MTSLFVFFRLALIPIGRGRRPARLVSPHIYLHWTGVSSLVGDKYTAGLITPKLRNRKQRCLLPATDNGVVWTGNGCLCMRGDQKPETRATVLCFKVDANRFTRGNRHGRVLIVNISRPCHHWVIHPPSFPPFYSPFRPHTFSIPLQTGRKGKEIGSLEEICLRTASWVAGISPVRVVFPYICFRAFFFDNLRAACVVLPLISSLWREPPGSLGSPLLAIQIFIAISGCILCTILVNLSLNTWVFPDFICAVLFITIPICLQWLPRYDHDCPNNHTSSLVRGVEKPILTAAT